MPNRPELVISFIEERWKLSYIGSRLAGGITLADKLTTTWTPGAVLAHHRFSQINAHDIGNRRQPGKHIGELAESVFVGTVSQRFGQFAELGRQPHERPLDTPFDIFRRVHVADQPLKIGQTNVGWLYRVRLVRRGYVVPSRKGLVRAVKIA